MNPASAKKLTVTASEAAEKRRLRNRRTSSIGAASEPGRGAVFTLRLPRSQDDGVTEP